MLLILGALILICIYYITKDRICGVTKNGVVSYCKIDQYNLKDHYQDGINTGKKWQCVEFVRRYYLQIYRLTFPSVEDAYALRRLTHMTRVDTKESIPCSFFPSGTFTPRVGDILILHLNPYGHTGIVVEVDTEHSNTLRIAEQNWKEWERPHDSRELSLNDPAIIGWIHVEHSEPPSISLTW